MKNISLIVIMVLALSSCKAQKKEVTFHPIVLKAKETSLYTDRIDWEKVNTKFISLTKNNNELKDALQYLINSLGDKHASVRSAKDHSFIAYYTGPDKGNDTRDYKFLNTVINDISAQFSYQLLGDNIGYLKVVGIGPGNVKEQADFIRKGVKDLNAKGVDKWILDLRYNGGGNMEPMLAGLAPLVGKGFIAGAINKTDDIRPYTITNGQFFNHGRLACEMNNTPKIATDEKVAVLLSRYTASSGELVAVAFKGRANTKFIGESTAGYTTGNGYDKINENMLLIISQDVFIDRNKNRYDKYVEVDEQIPFQHNTTIENDNQIDRAIAWLKNTN